MNYKQKIIRTNRANLPEFIRGLPDDMDQPVAVIGGSEYIEIIQYDGSGDEIHHWVIVQRAQLKNFIKVLQEVAGE